MTRRRALRLALIGVAFLVAVCLVGVVVLGAALVRRPFPDREGAISLSGLDGPVTVYRDERAVPQVYAESTDDLFRVQGYLHAQDRFFEMDLRRHITAGRLSELVGPSDDALEADTVIRTMGWRRVAAQELSLLTPAVRGYLDAYAQGVNDYLKSRSASQLSVSYSILGLSNSLPRIEPWTAVDSLAWLKAMAWDLRGNYDDELDRALTVTAVKDPERVAQLFPPYPYATHQPILPGERSQGSALPASSDRTATPSAQPPADGVAHPAQHVYGQPEVRRALELAGRAVQAVPGLLRGSNAGTGLGSNSWVLSGRLTASGKPMLANDPHLSTSIPGVWYQVGLHCRSVSASCPFDVAGYSFSGVPGVIIGHNARIAWGLTNLGPDVTDFYLEQVLDDQVLQDGKRRPLEVREEEIKVAGADPVRIRIRSSSHGPLLSDAISALADAGRVTPASQSAPVRLEGYAVALSWTALAPGRTMEAIFDLNTAGDFTQFRAAALKLEVPAQNLIYADVDGRIGYQAPGKIPIRPQPDTPWPVPKDGSWPVPGWDSSYDWRGFVPSAALPWRQDPAEGFIVAANQPVQPDGEPPFFTNDWDYGFRSQRIRDRIEDAAAAGRKLDAAAVRELQADTYNSMAAELVPSLLKSKVDSFTAQGQDLLRDWDFTQPPDSAAAAYYNAVWAQLLKITFDDELPAQARADGGSRWFTAVQGLLKKPADPWWDDRRTAGVVETRDEVLRRSQVQARLELTSTLGKDPATWTWGRLHRLELQQTPLGGPGVPGPIRALVNRGPFDAPGGDSIVSAFAWDAASDNFDVTAGPSMRMIVDLGNLDGSRWVNQTGASGHPWDEHYDDQVETWLTGGDYPWPFTERAVKAASGDPQEFTPAS